MILLIFPTVLFAQGSFSDTTEEKIIDMEINSVIYKDPTFSSPSDEDPNWNKLEKTLSKKYPQINASRLILGAKIRYYSIKKSWEKFADAYLTSLEKYDKIQEMTDHTKMSWTVNNILYNSIFKNVNNKKLLLRAAKQSKKIIDNPSSIKPGADKEEYSSNNIDTYANLLYKGGKTKKAIEWQQKALAYTKGLNKEFKMNLENMKKGIPTW